MQGPSICLAGTWLTGCLPEVDSGSVCVWEVSESKVAQVYKYTQCQPYIAIIIYTRSITQIRCQEFSESD